jgi:hypothetical protein
MRADRQTLQAVEPPVPMAFMATRVMAEIRSRPGARREFAFVRALSTAAAILVVAASIGVGTMVGAGLAQQSSAPSSSDSLLSVASTDPFIELQQTAVGGD